MAADGLLEQWAIAQTKLRAPAPGPRVLLRDRIEQRLVDLIENHVLTLVSAPAGWGKTTATSAWFRQSTTGIRAWLTLDAGDSEVDAFWAGAAAALREASFEPMSLLTALRTVRSPTSEWRRYAAALVNDLAEAEAHVVLVLDDLHTITDAVTLRSLATFIDLLPPNVRIVATTRTDPALPLALLRARGRLGELRAEALGFVPDEVDGYLNGIRHLSLGPESLRRLTDRTEGWAAVLALAGTSLEGLPSTSDRDAAIRDAVSTSDLYQFLSTELLDDRSETDRAFLLQTSILPMVDARLASEVTGVEDASSMLERLVDANIATRISDDWGETAYRYHELFAEFLRAELTRTCSKDHIAELHRRAAGAARTDEEGIEHLLAAELWDDAADRIEAVGRAQQMVTLVRLPASMLDAVPTEIRQSRPWIRLMRASIDVRQGQMVDAHRELTGIVEELRSRGDEGLPGALGAYCEAAGAVGDWDGAHAAVAELLAMSLPANQRVPALVTKVWLSYYGGDTVGIVDCIDEVGALDPVDPQVCEGWLLALDFKLLGAPIDPSVLEAHCVSLQRRCPESDVVDAASAGLRAGIEFLRGDIAAALDLVEVGRQASTRAGGLGWLEHELDLTLLMAALARSRHEEVERIAVPRLHDDDPISVLNRPQNAHALARSRWIRGDARGLEAVYADYLERESPDDGYEMALARTGVAHMLDRSAGDHQAAADRLTEALGYIPNAATFAVSQGHLEIDLATALLGAGKEHEAMNRVRGSLAELDARGLPGLVAQQGEPVIPLLRAAVDAGLHVAFAERVLALMDATPAAAFTVRETGERVTSRELEVLRLVAAGSSNRNIADQLFISERTVKSHMTAILRKLGVESRTAAASEARRLGLA